jgi:hypothetical protein
MSAAIGRSSWPWCASVVVATAVLARPVRASDNYFTDINVTSSGYLTASPGDNFFVGGNFTNNSTQTSLWNTSRALLGFQGGVTHQFYVQGVVGQFGWGTLQVGSGDAVTINGNSATAAATVNNGSLSAVSGVSSLGSLSGGGSIVVGGTSAANMTVTSLSQSAVTINSTGTLTLSAGTSPTTSSTNGLTITGGRLDLGNNTLLVHYESGLDPLTTIAGYVASAYDNGKWDGSGIYSSLITPSTAGTYAIGYADSADGVVTGLPANTIEIRYTRVGDANLDQQVNATDGIVMARHWLASGSALWEVGDFNYDGVVNLADANLLRNNWNESVMGSVAPGVVATPEPGVGIVGVVFAMILRRRR